MTKNLIIAAILIALLSGCGRRSHQLTLESLKNATYSLDSFEGMKVTLQDGRFQGKPGADDDSEFEVGMMDRTAFGQIHGVDAAAVILYWNSGGTGTFIDLALMLRSEGKAVNIATMNLGDRVRVNEVSIDHDTIYVAMTIHGPEDPMCCPTLDVRRAFLLRDTVIVEPNASASPEPNDLN